MHDHSHDHSIHLEEGLHKEKKAFYSAIVIAFLFMLLEIIGGLIANSLALISDALHMFTDVGALVLGLIVITIFKKPVTAKKTYGYERAEVLGALASGVTLWILMFFLIYEGILRLMNPPEVKGGIVFIIATIGLIANIIMMKLLHPGAEGSLNLRAAYLHVLGDLLGSVGVIISGVIIWFTKWYPIDPIITFLIAILIFRTSGKMMKTAIDILMEGVPSHINAKKIQKDLQKISGVKEVHDLHIWSLSSKKTCLSVHLIAEDSKNTILNEAHSLLQREYKIPHMTIQIEDENHFDPKFCYDCQKNSK